MDSLTQFALGACVAGAAAPKAVSPRLLLGGGVLATLPDLDSIFIQGDALTVISEHRSWSHSLLMLALATPLFAWVLGYLSAFKSLRFRRRCLLVYLVFVTHTLLDALTVYGTQLLWPLDRTPFALSTIFIIDPLYTLPLIVALVAAWLNRVAPARATRAIRRALALSSVYLMLTFAAKFHIEGVADQMRQRVAAVPDAARVLTMPTPFNIALWRVLIVEPGRYHEGFVGLLDGGKQTQVSSHPSGSAITLRPQAQRNLERVMRFSGPWVRMREVNGQIVAEDLRMGLEPDYFFRFVLDRPASNATSTVPTVPGKASFKRLRWLGERLTNPRLEPPG